MKNIPFYQVDAFTDRLFSGNPAGVCFLDQWLDDQLMQHIAHENNLAETAFVVPRATDFEIRWFTPAVEVDLCGHATLAAGFLLSTQLRHPGEEVKFFSPRSGWLRVFRKQGLFYLDFPTDTIEQQDDEIARVTRGIGIRPLELYKGKTDYLAVLGSEAEVRNIQPNLPTLTQLRGRGLIVTAPGMEVDFVSRFFAPQSGIDEDPVTGSAHTSLTPLWSKKLNKKLLTARQLSPRGGNLHCEYHNDRCLIGGNACLYLAGELFLNS